MAAYEFPVNVCKINIEGEDKLRTSASYIRTVLADEGVQVQDFIIEDDEEQQISTLGGVSMALASACAKLKDSGIYEKVIMDIDRAEYSDSTTSDVGQVQVNIKLEEKKWYKIYIGAGVKQQGSGIIMNESSQLGALPMAQFEASASLSNIRGCTDTTNISYTLDQASTPTFFVSHDTPATVEIDDMQHSSIRLLVDTMDFEHARSYKEFQRSFSYRLSNARAFSPMLMEGIWKSLEWNAVWRDLLPCRFPNAPFACDASPHVIAEAGPSLKHSLSFDYKLNGAYLDNRLAPTRGFDFSSTTEFAGPPGDVGFFKMNKFLSFHLPLNFLGLSLHTSLSTGFVRPINFGGTCNRVTPISDRFFVGGPLHLRGFEAAGIGPRADSEVGARGGDSLGGELYYTSTLAISAPFPHKKFRESGARLMGFANFGNLTGWGVPLEDGIRSSRSAIGLGAFCPTPLGRIECTYSKPLVSGPNDKTESFQFGFGLSFS